LALDRADETNLLPYFSTAVRDIAEAAGVEQHEYCGQLERDPAVIADDLEGVTSSGGQKHDV
jgi:hypothetical protein